MTAPGVVQCLDVRELEPPEPLNVILSSLRQLPSNQALKVQHRREPFPLYSMLTELGYDYRCSKVAEEDYRLYIWATGQADLQACCEADLNSDRSL